MSSGASAAPAVHRVPRRFESVSAARSTLNSAASVASPAVMLVGRNGSWGSSVLKSLQKFGCELSFEAPQNVTPRFAEKGAYDVILLDSTVLPEQRRELTSELAGSGVSIVCVRACRWVETRT